MGTKKTAEPDAQNTAELFSVDEFVNASEALYGIGTSPDLVRAALLKTGKQLLSEVEARKAVEAFSKKEVKKS